MARKQKLIHLHGTTPLTAEKAKSAGMAVGEIAIKNSTEGASELYVLTQDGNTVETFITSTAIDAKIKVVGDKVNALIGDDGSIATSLSALKADLEGQIDGVETAFNTYKTEHDTEYTQFKQTNSDAIAAAKKAGTDAAADAAQALIDAKAYADDLVKDADGKVKFDAVGSAAAAEGRVNATIGTVTAGKTVVDMIDAAQKVGTNAAAQALTDAKTYTNEAEGRVNATIGTVAEGKTVVKMIEEAAQAGADAADAAAQALTDAKAYAKEYTDDHEEKTDIHITADERTLWTDAAEGFNTFMDGEGLDATLDTLKEIQDWLKNENNKDASDIIQMISTETSERKAADKAITDSIGTVTEGKTVAEMIADAEAAAKGHANSLAGNYDAAGSAAAVEGRLNAKIGTVTEGKTVVDMIAAAQKAGEDAAGEAEGRVNATIGTVAEGKTVVKMIEEAEAAAKGYANGLAGNYDAAGSAAQALTDAKAYAKEYADDAIEALTNTVTGKNEYVASTHVGTNLGVTVVQTNGTLTSLTIDDSNLVIDCGTYDA